MTGPVKKKRNRRPSGPTERTRQMVEAYVSGLKMEEVAVDFDVSKQRIWAVVKRYAPGALAFKGLGTRGDRLFNVGRCSKCEIPLFSERRVARTLCGLHEPDKPENL